MQGRETEPQREMLTGRQGGRAQHDRGRGDCHVNGKEALGLGFVLIKLEAMDRDG
jgi:hypothetical protein